MYAEDYAPYHVPEVWLFKTRGLAIYHLHGDAYQQHSESLYFPGVGVPALIAQVVHDAAERGTGAALRELRQRLIS